MSSKKVIDVSGDVKRKKKKKSAGTYDESNIQMLKGPEKVRKKPGMYLGERGDPMVYRGVKEIVDNVYDEFSAGRNKLLEVIFDPIANVYIVADQAQGIPVGMNKEEKRSTLELIFTELHAGGKFDDKAYKTSSGTHGVGAAATNAVCSTFRVWTQRDKQWWSQSYEKGVPTSKVEKCKPPKIKHAGFELHDKVAKYGSIIQFSFDQTIVSESATEKKAKKLIPAKLNLKSALVWLSNLAMLNPGFTIRVSAVGAKKSKQYTFLNKEGLPAIVKKLAEDNELSLVAKPFVYQSDTIDCVVQWSSHTDTDLFGSFVNCSPTRDHGKHVDGFVSALGKVLNANKGARDKFKVSDALNGLIGSFNFKMNGAEYSSQTKDRLTSLVNKEVEEALLPAITEYFEKNKTLIKTVIKRATEIGKGRDQLKAVMKSVSGVTKGNAVASVSAFLTTANRCKPEDRELYIVEGDSAAGTAKEARDPRNQEVFKLTGKLANAIRTDLPTLVSTKAVGLLLVALGIDTKNIDFEQDISKIHFSTNKLRVGKIMLLSDADVDGKHINTLLLSLIWRLVPDAIREGRVFVVDAPLYSAFYGNVRYFGASFEDVAKQLPDRANKNIISRAKGWGEIEADMLKFVAFDPKNRSLIQIQPPKDGDGEAYFKSIMGENTQARKDLLGL